MKKVFLYDQDRALLIFLLLADLKKDEIIYFTYRNKEKILAKLKGKKVLIDGRNFIFKKRINFIFWLKKFRKENKNLLKEIKENKVQLYGIDYLELAKRIFYDEPINVIEEGTVIFSPLHEKNLKYKIKYFLTGAINFIFRNRERIESFDYDENNKVVKVYLTDNLCKELPQKIKKKGEVINLKNLWDKKTLEEKEYILNVFSVNKEILKNFSNKSIILVTQPLSEDNVITEKEKIEIYSKVLKKYKNSSIIIKPHPRETTDYSKYFLNCYIMQEKYPIEILALLGIKIERIVTLFSGAAFGFEKEIKIDFYGTEVNEKIFMRFGTQDNIMKRNAFLD